MQIFTRQNPATIVINGLCSGVVKLCNEVIYTLENALIMQGFLSGANILGDSNTIITTAVLNIASKIKANQVPFLSVLPTTEQLSAIKINSISVDQTTGILNTVLTIISVAGASAPATISLGA